MIELDQISKTHDWDRGNELWVCKKCKLTPIGAHVWGDAEWTATAKKCQGRKLMTEGTISYLFGCHQFFFHPLWVLFAWRLEYKSWPKLWQIICIFLHDVGICGRQYISDDEAKPGHWILGAVLAKQLFTRIGRCDLAEKAWFFIGGHCPSESCLNKSKLFLPDKRSYLVEPMWMKWVNYYIEDFEISNPVDWTERVRENLKRELPLGGHELYLSLKNGKEVGVDE